MLQWLPRLITAGIAYAILVERIMVLIDDTNIKYQAILMTVHEYLVEFHIKATFFYTKEYWNEIFLASKRDA